MTAKNKEPMSPIYMEQPKCDRNGNEKKNKKSKQQSIGDVATHKMHINVQSPPPSYEQQAFRKSTDSLPKARMPRGPKNQLHTSSSREQDEAQVVHLHLSDQWDAMRIRKQHRTRVMWTTEEKEALVRGVQVYGFGKWKIILDAYADIFHKSRRPWDLSDKYRIIQRVATYYTKRVEDYCVVDEDNVPLVDAHGQVTIYKERFAWNVAQRAAKLKLKDSKNAEIRVMETVENPWRVHTYVAVLGVNKINVAKTGIIDVGDKDE